MRYFLGSMLVGCGVIVAGTMGLCTLVILSTSSPIHLADVFQAVVPIGVPFAIGIGLIIGGKKLMSDGKDY